MRKQVATHRKPKLTMLYLLKLCKEHGVDDGGIDEIAGITGWSRKNIIKWIDEYCIIPNLSRGGLAEDI